MLAVRYTLPRLLERVKKPMPNMKGGIVVTLRLNPQDVMSCVDIVDMTKLPLPPGTSISQVIKIAFEGLIEYHRKHGGLPQRDGFEFEQMMSRFTGVRHGRKVSVTSTLEEVQASRIAADLPHALAVPKQTQPIGDDSKLDGLIREKARLIIRVRELSFKYDNDLDNMTDAERSELGMAQDRLQQINEELER